MKQATNIINLSKNCAHKSPLNEPPEDLFPEMSRYLKMMRSQYIM